MTEEEMIAMLKVFNRKLPDTYDKASKYSIEVHCKTEADAQAIYAYACLHNYETHYPLRGDSTIIQIG